MADHTGASVAAFIDAWNEPDADRRQELLDGACASGATFTIGASTIRGGDALGAYIGEALERAPERMVEQCGWLESLGGRSGFRWCARAADGTTTQGEATIEVTASGLLRRVTSAPNESEPAAVEATSLGALRAWAHRNPLAPASLFVLVMYLVLRFQAERFYGTFGLTPEDAGFGPVDLVMRQATHVLLNFVWVGLLWSALYLSAFVPVLVLARVRSQQADPQPRWELFTVGVLAWVGTALMALGLIVSPLLCVPGVLFVGTLLLLPRWRYPAATKARAEARAQVLRWSALVILVGTVGMGVGAFAIVGFQQADSDANAVHAGDWVDSTDYPWQARPAIVSWKARNHPVALPTCRFMRYLGEANDRLILYNSRTRETLRVAPEDVELTLPSVDRC